MKPNSASRTPIMPTAIDDHGLSEGAWTSIDLILSLRRRHDTHAYFVEIDTPVPRLRGAPAPRALLDFDIDVERLGLELARHGLAHDFFAVTKLSNGRLHAALILIARERSLRLHREIERFTHALIDGIAPGDPVGKRCSKVRIQEQYRRETMEVFGPMPIAPIGTIRRQF